MSLYNRYSCAEQCHSRRTEESVRRCWRYSVSMHSLGAVLHIRSSLQCTRSLYDSKGLEYDDVRGTPLTKEFTLRKNISINQVILYNFFEDSLVDYTQWRRLIHAAPAYGDPRPNAELCIEVCAVFFSARCTRLRKHDHQLKFLYVAITRARHNVVFMDRSRASEPMKVISHSVA